MRSFILLVLALMAAMAASFDLRSAEVFPRNLIVPVDKLDGRIVNGKIARAGAFPYQVGLSLKINWLATGWCGGALISKKWVATAAHCTDGVQSVTVYLGSIIRAEAKVSFTVGPDKIIIHEGWNSKTVRNDISLINIPSVTTSNEIQPAKLPKIANSYSSYAGAAATISGWGRMSDSSSAIARELRYGSAQIIKNPDCAATFGNLITPEIICIATLGNSSPCQGDSGGPLKVDSSGILVGLVSFGSSDGCGNGGPVAFTRITSYLEWIKKNSGVSS